MGRMLLAAGITAGVTLAVDQVSKAVVRAKLPVEYREGGTFEIGNRRNYGSSFGILPKVTSTATFGVSAVLGGAMLIGGNWARNPMMAAIGAGAALGGGIGNGIDRARDGYVTDFIHTTGAFGYYNLADVSLIAGVGLTTLAFVRHG